MVFCMFRRNNKQMFEIILRMVGLHFHYYHAREVTEVMNLLSITCRYIDLHQHCKTGRRITHDELNFI